MYKKPDLKVVELPIAGFDGWMHNIIYYCDFHHFLPMELMEFDDLSLWKACFVQRCFDSMAVDIALGLISIPQKRLKKPTFKSWFAELKRFMNRHNTGFPDSADDIDLHEVFKAGVSPLIAVDIILGYLRLGDEESE